MAKISELTELTSLTGNEWVSIADTGGGATYKAHPGLVLLERGDLPSSDNLDIDLTGYTAFNAVKLLISGMTNTNDSVSLGLQFSDDGGATFEEGTSDYEWGRYYLTAGGGAGDAHSTADTDIEVIGAFGNDANAAHSAEINIFDFASAANKTAVRYYTVNSSLTNQVVYGSGAGRFIQTDDATDVRLFLSGGTYDGGTYALYGMVGS